MQSLVQRCRQLTYFNHAIYSNRNSTTVAAATLARDTAISSESSALTTKDGGDTVGTKPLPGMQFNVNNACTTMEDLAKAYKTVKEGSTVSLIESHEDQNADGSTSTGESAKTVTEATSDGDRICLGSTCFLLGIPCAGTSAVTDEEAGSGRRLARQKEIFERTLDGTHSFLRERQLKKSCCDSKNVPSCCDSKGCVVCSSTGGTTPVAKGVVCGNTICVPADGCGNASCSCCGVCTQAECGSTS